jgi:hypothetical protein
MGKVSSDLRWIARQWTATFSWDGVAWFIVVGLGCWGAAISIGAFVTAYVCVGISAILCALKWAYVTEIDTRNKRVWAFILGMIFLSSLTAGIAFWTYYCQSTTADVRKNLESLEQIADLQAQLDKAKQSNYELKKGVEAAIPKLDAMVDQPDPEEQKNLALDLREQFTPKIEVNEPSLGDRNSFDFQLLAAMENVGGSTAKGVVAASNMAIATKSSYSEEKLFEHLYDDALDSTTKPVDIDPGYTNRVNFPITSHPNAMRLDMIRRMNRDEVVYIGVRVTYSDSQGRQHSTERCFYFDTDSMHVDHVCDAHNTSD